MSKRKPSEKPAEASVAKSPVRVPRRKRRKPDADKSSHGAAPAKVIGRPATRHTPPPEPGDLPPYIKPGRAPRAAEPPPPNPAIFSYTFRIWKST